jgi:hypothetical protein
MDVVAATLDVDEIRQGAAACSAIGAGAALMKPLAFLQKIWADSRRVRRLALKVRRAEDAAADAPAEPQSIRGMRE